MITMLLVLVFMFRPRFVCLEFDTYKSISLPNISCCPGGASLFCFFFQSLISRYLPQEDSVSLWKSQCCQISPICETPQSSLSPLHSFPFLSSSLLLSTNLLEYCCDSACEAVGQFSISVISSWCDADEMPLLLTLAVNIFSLPQQ